MATLETIYEDFTRGSNGFVKAVQTWCGFDMSNAEIERIAEKAETPDEFTRIWENETWWADTDRK